MRPEWEEGCNLTYSGRWSAWYEGDVEACRRGVSHAHVGGEMASQGKLREGACRSLVSGLASCVRGTSRGHCGWRG